MAGGDPDGWHEASEAFTEPSRVPAGGFRDRIRHKPGIGHAYRVGVFVVGVAFILLGLLILASEFAWAQRLLDRAKEKAREAWQQAVDHPVSSALVTGSGLIGAGAVIWAYFHYDLRDKLPF